MDLCVERDAMEDILQKFLITGFTMELLQVITTVKVDIANPFFSLIVIHTEGKDYLNVNLEQAKTP